MTRTVLKLKRILRSESKVAFDAHPSRIPAWLLLEASPQGDKARRIKASWDYLKRA